MYAMDKNGVEPHWKQFMESLGSEQQPLKYLYLCLPAIGFFSECSSSDDSVDVPIDSPPNFSQSLGKSL